MLPKTTNSKWSSFGPLLPNYNTFVFGAPSFFMGVTGMAYHKEASLSRCVPHECCRSRRFIHFKRRSKRRVVRVAGLTAPRDVHCGATLPERPSDSLVDGAAPASYYRDKQFALAHCSLGPGWAYRVSCPGGP